MIRINRVDMMPYEQDIYDEGRPVTVATYADYKTYGAMTFPSVITIKRPQDEYSLKIEVTKLTLNETLDDIQFELKLPAGIPVQKME